MKNMNSKITISSAIKNNDGTIDITDSNGITYKNCYLTNVNDHIEEDDNISMICTMTYLKDNYALN